MNRLHKTKNGRRLFISQMDDSHLTNTLSLICRNVAALRQVAEGVQTSKNSVFYGIDSDSAKAEARHRLVNAVRLIEPYAAECALRGIDVSKELQDTLGREGKEEIQISTNSLMLESDYDEDDEDDYDEMYDEQF